ncbi:uncharacterized protein LOC122371492 [Amphibalanus amphitrite]|uniref:uncharacterized protein LOC122371492 n=1 Tax=Amphibalanus amphitrite TaxID=1232801 RepID=UPI001C9285CB|nr:uncharacterized protein LOC122371492 [Amphibalanus amphitrite]
MLHSLIPMAFLLHMLMLPSAFGVAIQPQQNGTFVPDPVLLLADPDLPAGDLGPAGLSQLGKPGSIEQPAQNVIRSRTDPEPEPEFELLSGPDGGVTVTARLPPDTADSLERYSVFRLTSLDRSIKHCVPLAADGPGVLRARGRHLPLSSYCVQLGCSCRSGRPCRRRPSRCRRYEHRAGIDMRAWRRTSNVSVWRHDDTAAGPSVSVSVQQTGFRFESFIVSVLGCRAVPVFQTTAAADRWLRLDTNCSLQYNTSLLMQVLPDTWFCAGGTGGCRDLRVHIGPLQRLPPSQPPPLLRAAALPGWLTAGLALLALVTAAVAVATLLWSRRRHRRYVDRAATAGCYCLTAGGGLPAAPRVLLLHLARSDAERAALRQLTAELRLRGASVVDSDAPEWRRAARLAADAPTLDSLVPGAAYTLPEHQRELVTALLAGTSCTKGAAADAVLPADITVAELTVVVSVTGDSTWTA